MMKLKRLSPYAIIPGRAHPTDAGLDVFTKYAHTTWIDPHKDYLIEIGWAMSLPDGWVAIVKEKSGLAWNKKITIGSCVIDSSYRGEIMIHLFNNSDERIEFAPGSAIAQLVIVPCWCGNPRVVDDLDETDRGEGGFGSTTSKPEPMKNIEIKESKVPKRW